MAKLPDWVKRATQKKKGSGVSDSVSKLTEGVGPADEAKKASDTLPDGIAFENYFLSAYRTLKTLDGSGALAEANVSVEDWIVLRVLEKNYGPVQLRDLVKATDIAPRELRKIIAGLKARSLINISEEKPKQLLISVSRSGLSVLAKTSIVFNMIASESSRFSGKMFGRYDVISTHVRRVLQKLHKRRSGAGDRKSDQPTEATSSW